MRLLHVFHRQLHSLRQSGYAGGILRRGALSPFLTAAVYYWSYLKSLFHIEKSNALGAVYLVSAHGQHIYIHFSYVNGIFSKGLDSIDMKKRIRIFLLYQLSDSRRVLYRSDLVVHKYNADKHCIIPD